MKIKLIENAGAVLWRSWANRAAVGALAVPEIAQAVADHVDFIPFVTDDTKQVIRAVLVATIPLWRILEQRKLRQIAEAPSNEPR